VNKKDEKILMLEQTILSREAEINSLKLYVKRLQGELDNIREARDDIVAECGFEIDYRGLNAFSIERTIVNKDKNQKYDREKTIIGHIVDGKINEWSFSCSRETHERLVKEFKDYIRLKHQV
jgi:predicted  nucleic acid-binding Zn-ribbon protein